MLIQKVWERAGSSKYPQKIVTIPQSSDIKAGDYVKIIKVKRDD